MLGDVPTTADVRVRGASGTLSRLSPGDIVAVLDLRGARPGERLFHLTPEQVRAPFGVEVVQVTPPTVAVVFETTASRSVPIEPAIEGKPAAGYMVGKIVVTPPSVEVVGPESAVRRVTEALTEPVSVADAQRRVQESVNVGTLDPALRVKTLRTATVTVRDRSRAARADRPRPPRSSPGPGDESDARLSRRRRSTSRFAEAARRSRGFRPTMRRRLSIWKALAQVTTR